MTRRSAGEALFWAGFATMAVACLWQELTGNQFALMFGAGAAGLFGGLYLMASGPARVPRPPVVTARAIGERLIIAGGLVVGLTGTVGGNLPDLYFTAGIVVGVAMIFVGVVWS